ncbi:MAG: tRNA lysidine(34) synthetase TilS [Bacteroidales bacterium]|nr:tRNA lysidine(34) synthetase TilS [Bacteroidales bacterium]
MKQILLAVSGGIDSMYMANRASELFPEAHFAVAHCNFQLRGKESDDDEEFVENWCKEHHLKCFVKRFDTRESAAEQGISIEMAARQLRYEWFEQLRTELGFDAIATAHNACDNAETMILNLLRGTGIKGICGMSSTERIIRPLLGIERKDIENWMNSHGLTWREDSSNGQNIYKRNMIRREIFPLFAQLNPSYIKTLNSDMERFAQVGSIADDYVKAVRKTVLHPDGRINLHKLQEFKHWEYALWNLLEGSGISSSEFADLTACIKAGRQIAGKCFGPVIGTTNSLIINSQKREKREIKVELILRNELTSLITEPGVILLDADKISMPLKIRGWKEGDWMRPLGMKGKKKLSDLFTDLKYSALDKAEAQVIELEGSHIAALVGVRIDDRVKVDDKTENVLRISYSSIK